VIFGVDTDVLVAWAMRGHPRHFAARSSNPAAQIVAAMLRLLAQADELPKARRLPPAALL